MTVEAIASRQHTSALLRTAARLAFDEATTARESERSDGLLSALVELWA